jgi:hypothetical protein
MTNVAQHLARQANRTTVQSLQDRYEELKMQMQLVSKRLIREELEMIQLVVYCDFSLRPTHPGMIRLQQIASQLAGKTIQVIYEDLDLQDLLDEGVQLVHDYRWY